MRTDNRFNSITKMRVLAILTVALFSHVPLIAIAEDSEAEESFTFEEKLQSCAACHGENGDKPLAPEYPILAGQYADYITQALKQYRNGRRTNPIMMQQVELLELSDADMKALGQYFAAKPGLKNLKH